MKIHVYILWIFLLVPCVESVDWSGMVGSVKETTGKIRETIKKAVESTKAKIDIPPAGNIASEIGERMKGMMEKMIPGAKELIKKFSNHDCWDVDLYALDVEECNFNVDFRGEHKIVRTDCNLRRVVAGGKCMIGADTFARTSADIEIRIGSVRFVKSKVMDCDDEEFKKEVEGCEAEMDQDLEIILTNIESGSINSEFMYNLAKDTGLLDLLSKKMSSLLQSKLCSIIDDNFFGDGGKRVIYLIQTELAANAINKALSEYSTGKEIIKIPISMKAFGVSANIAELNLRNLRSRIFLQTGYFGMKDKVMKADLDLEKIEIEGLAQVAGYDAKINIEFHGLELSTVVDASDASKFISNCHFSLKDVNIVSGDFQWEDQGIVSRNILKATQYLLGVVKFDSLVMNYVRNILENNVCKYFENQVIQLLEERLGDLIIGEEL